MTDGAEVHGSDDVVIYNEVSDYDNFEFNFKTSPTDVIDDPLSNSGTVSGKVFGFIDQFFH